MSKFCGICDLELRTASPQDVARVREGLNRQGYSRPQVHQDDGILVGWAAGCEAPRREGIFQSPERMVCVWDGRLDNSADLLRRTGLPPDSPEGAIVLSLYRKSGADGLGALVGDWSACIWDPDRRQIVLASDYAGIRPLYYQPAGDRIYFSTSLADLVGWTGVTRLDDAYVAGFLGGGDCSARTPYAGIFAVPAAEAVTIHRGSLVRRRFWHLPVERETRYPEERQYQEQLLELFQAAVRVRLGEGPAACAELSGGLDSSSVVCMADRLRKELPGELPGVTTFSYTHETSLDEKFFLEVERACDLPACHFELRDYPLVAPESAGIIPAWWEPRFRKLAHHMTAMGSGVLLTGQLGDLIMGNVPDDASQVTEQLAKGQLRKAAREAYAWSRAMQVPIYPILWRSVREAYFSWVPSIDPRAAVGAMRISLEDSLTEDMRGRLHADRPDEGLWRQVPPGRRVRFRTAAEMLLSRRLQAPEALQHLSYTHPYADRPLVEFMLTIPTNILLGPNQPRRLMRRAFAGLLPRMILNRRSKGEYGSIFRDSVIPLATALLRDPAKIQVVERGYVDRQSLQARLEKYTQGLDCNEMQLQTIVLFEFWLQNRAAQRAIS